MKKVLLALLAFSSNFCYADMRDSIAATRPCENQSSPKAAIKESGNARNKECMCPDCKCQDYCSCSKDKGCTCPGCKKTVEKCVVMVNGVCWTIADMTAEEANAAIKAQGNDVIFLKDSVSKLVVPAPSWYKGTLNSYAYSPPAAQRAAPVAPSFSFGGDFRFSGGFAPNCPPGKP